MRRRVPDLGKLLFVLPNLFTMSAVLCGFYAITTLASGSGMSLCSERKSSHRVRWIFRWNGWARRA